MPDIYGLPVSEEVYELYKKEHGEEACGINKAASKPASKYHNTRTTLDGLRFASGKEAARAKTLMLLEQQKQIFGLRFQVNFPLFGGIIYRADAQYSEIRDGRLELVVEDTKGFRTKEYQLKKKLFKEKYGKEITEL